MATKSSTSEASASKLLGKINDLLVDIVDDEFIKRVVDETLPGIKEKLTELYGGLPQITRITLPTLEERTITGITHEKFPEILSIVNQNIPVYLEGPAGSGKNVICKRIAEALGLDFYFTNAVTQEYKLTGFIDAYGKFQETQFYKAFKNGGLFFLDEMDASIPEVLIILNAAIANRYFDFPNGKIEAHPNFRVIAAGNTVGTGADSNYTGRFCLDRASLDRFAMIHIDYSPLVESSICNDNEDLLNFVHEFRRATKAAGIECLCSYRTLERVCALEKILPLKEVLNISLLKGLEEDDINIIKGEMKGMEKNKYFQEGICGVDPKRLELDSAFENLSSKDKEDIMNEMKEFMKKMSVPRFSSNEDDMEWLDSLTDDSPF